MSTILLTGTAGFIGANFVPHVLARWPDRRFISLDALTYAGDLKNLDGSLPHARHEFIQGDICDRGLLEKIFREHDVQGVIHFAAESHVDNSISGPGAFIQTNVVGTFTLLDVARQYWMASPGKARAGHEKARFLHISTDEVYGTLGDTGLFTEETPYAPNSPYSASKASSDMVVRSYFHTYGMDVVTTNCSNNYGPRQHPEKLIPTIIRKALAGQAIPIYGDGKNIRDWLYVEDHCAGIALAFEAGVAGETYNIGGRNERTNIEIARHICRLLDERRPAGKPHDRHIQYVADRPGHDRRYAIDATKIETKLGWRARENFESGIMKAVDWYLGCP
jgi:dTDP-glucose 4,6-dehydratase